MRQKNLVQQIKETIKEGKVKEPFKPKDFPFLIKSPSFISKHSVGNGNYTEYRMHHSALLIILGFSDYFSKQQFMFPLI
jgi:hypothetical protein